MIVYIFVTALAVLGCSCVLAAESVSPASAELGDVGRDEQKVQQVLAGQLDEANAAWWGFNEDDATDAIQAAIKSGAARVVIPDMGKPWIVRSLKLRSDLELVLEDGVELLAKKGAFLGKTDSLLHGLMLRNVTIRGYGATLRMRKDDYTKPPYAKAEWRNGISMVSCVNVTILGLTIKDSGGDGIYLGTLKKGLSTPAWCENVLIKDVVCDGNYRQGMSLVSVTNLLVEDSVVKNTSGTKPSAGIDLEMHGDFERLVNVTIRNVLSQNNDGFGFLVYYLPNTEKSQDVSILFDRCRVDGSKFGLAVGGNKENGPKGSIEFRDCVVENTSEHGAYVYDKSHKGANVKFTRCTFRDVNQSRGTHTDFNPAENKSAESGESFDSALLLFAQRPNLVATLGGVVFDDCTVEDIYDRPALAVGGRGSYSIFDINGSIGVINPYGARVQSPVPLSVKLFRLPDLTRPK